MNKYAKYSKDTASLLLSLLARANEDQKLIDRMLEEVSNDVIKDFEKLLNKLVKDGKIDLNQPFRLEDYPAVASMVKEIEYREWTQRMDTLFSWLNVVYAESLTRTYQTTSEQTYLIFGYSAQPDKNRISFLPFSTSQVDFSKLVMPEVKITDTYITQQVLSIPWCQDGKTYSQRLYSHVANFQSKLNFVLEKGITQGKGYDWMVQAWRKLTKSTAYDAARLLKTETVAMWSLSTKATYLSMGIEYVEIIGDAACGGICTDYVGEAIPLRTAELGDELPPYHPNCACSYIAYEEVEDDNSEIEEELD